MQDTSVEIVHEDVELSSLIVLFAISISKPLKAFSIAFPRHQSAIEEHTKRLLGAKQLQVVASGKNMCEGARATGRNQHPNL